MKATAIGLLVANVGTAFAGHCCCTWWSETTVTSTLFRCNNGGPDAFSQQQEFSVGNCNNEPSSQSLGIWRNATCLGVAAGGDPFLEPQCHDFTKTGYSADCEWHDEASGAYLAFSSAILATVVVCSLD